ncbi:MAG: hypothetical protein JWL59_4868 [Chthoniobacteraceae bacterium]|nr:hypothetical protein [Chthoniobacteraceae bacterium]
MAYRELCKAMHAAGWFSNPIAVARFEKKYLRPPGQQDMSTLEDFLRDSETYKTFAISSQPPRFGDETSTSVTLSYHGAGKSNRPEVGIINDEVRYGDVCPSKGQNASRGICD